MVHQEQVRKAALKNKEETFASRYANGTGPFMLVSRVLSTCWIEDKFSP